MLSVGQRVVDDLPAAVSEYLHVVVMVVAMGSEFGAVFIYVDARDADLKPRGRQTCVGDVYLCEWSVCELLHPQAGHGGRPVREIGV